MELTTKEFLQSEVIFNKDGIGMDSRKIIEDIISAYVSDSNNISVNYNTKPNYYKVMSDIIGHIKHLSKPANVLYYAICSDLPYITLNDIYAKDESLLKRIQVSFFSDYKEELSRRCEISVKTIDRCIADLVKADLLIKRNPNVRNGIYYVNPKYILKGVDAAQKELIKELVILYNGEECFKVNYKL
jgi:hypothetical protein